MIKKIISLALLMLCMTAAHAEFVPSDVAQAEAIRFATQHIRCYRAQPVPQMQQIITPRQRVRSQQGQLPAYYIFNIGQDGGWVIVSAESTTLDILAYSDHGSFHVEHIDKGAEVFLRQYELDAETARTQGLTAAQQNFVAASEGEGEEVLLETASLSQEDGYWLSKYTPVEDAPAGCPATAAAILMRYHQWPTQGQGTHAYTTETHHLQLSHDYSQDTYNWADIPLEPYLDGNWSEAAQDETARVMLALGIAFDTDYNAGASGSTPTLLMAGMVRNFSYSIGLNYSFYLDENPDYTAGYAACRDNIAHGRPVFVGSIDHVFVMDGYNDVRFHYNMGWGGFNSGWYANGGISLWNYSLLGIITDLRPATDDILQTGTSGSVSWTLSDRGLLTLSGVGSLPSKICQKVQNYFLVPEAIIEQGITGIGDNDFTECINLERLTIPSTVLFVRGYPFTDTRLRTVVCKATNPPTLQCADALQYCRTDIADATLYVPYAAWEAYRNAEGWKDFGTILPYDPPVGVTDLPVESPSTSRPIYNLQGQRIPHPQRGVNVIGGKAVLCK